MLAICRGTFSGEDIDKDYATRGAGLSSSCTHIDFASGRVCARALSKSKSTRNELS